MTRRHPIPALLLACILLGGTPATAATELSERAYERITRAQNLMEAERYEDAVEALQALARDVAHEDYAYAVAYQIMGYAYISLDRHDDAAESFERALAADALPDDVAQRVRHNLGQLYVHTRQYRDGIRVLEAWLDRTEAPDARTLFLIANAYYRLEDYAPAARYGQRAIRAADEPRESWYRLVMACYVELQRYDAVAELLEEAVTLFPDEPVYWRHLANAYLQLDESGKALAVWETRHGREPLTGDDLLRLVRLYLHRDIPYRAARELEAALEDGRVAGEPAHWELLANTWTRAREPERAVDALTAATRAGGNGQLALQRGRLLIELERYGEAVDAMTTAVADDQALRDPGRAYLLLGIAHYRNGDPENALQAFDTAREYDGVSDEATRWHERVKTDVR